MTAPDVRATFDDFMAQLKVCGTCRALLLAASVDEHKQWHRDQITLLEDYVGAALNG